MKKYIKPICETVELKTKNAILVASGGIGNGSGTPGNQYSGGDVSYGHDDDFDW